MVSEPVRCDAFGFAVALNETEPLPLPVPPLVIVSHDVLLLAAVQEQPPGAVTLAEPVPPAAGTEPLGGASENVQPAAAWVTVNVWPATVSVPPRGEAFGFTAALNVTAPPPLPVAPPVIVSHEVSLLTPVHAQPPGVVTVVDPVPPAAVTDVALGAIVYVHGAAACVTVNVCPPMVSVPLRCEAFGLPVALKLTAPLPLPPAPLVIVSHEMSLLTAVHAQPPGAVTAVEPVVPPNAIDALVGAIAYVHGAAACVTVNVCPPTVSAPLRCDALGLAVALKLTVPLPLPLAPLVIVSHEVALLTAVHAQPPGAVTAVDPVAPPNAMDTLAGAIAYVHGAAACVTVSVCPPMVSVPLRCDPFGFAVALKLTVPLPLPLAPLVIVSHDVSLLTAVHAQPPGAVTAVEPGAPPNTMEALVGAMAYVHGAAACVTVNVCPPAVNVPLRCDAFGLAVALKLTVPLPFPVPPLVIVSQDVSLLTAVHEQPLGAVIAVDPVPPPNASDALVGAIEYVHGAAA
jgi:hypothetical protein